MRPLEYWKKDADDVGLEDKESGSITVKRCEKNVTPRIGGS
jgi:hypothetical protein